MNLYVVYFKPLEHSACGPKDQAAVTLGKSMLGAGLKIDDLYPEREVNSIMEMMTGDTFKSNWFYVE